MVKINTKDTLPKISQYGSEFNAKKLPSEFIEWQMTSRHEAYERVANGERPTSFSSHLPVVVSLNQGGSFATHTATKGTGFTPLDEHLDYYINLFNDCLVKCKGKPWLETLDDRISVIRELYAHQEHIDFRRLGMLEIFRGRTFQNLMTDPRITLHYTGEGPEYPSFQINGRAEIIGPEDKHFQFVYLARQLFEHDQFHIHQPDYPFGYLIWVQEIYDKSPFHGRAGHRIEASSRKSPIVEFKDILIPVDNSRFANYCMSIGMEIAGHYDSTITGIHVYAARLHDKRFKQMEAVLPPQYQEPRELERQRNVHDSLITEGLQLISDSYLDVLANRCDQAEIDFNGKRPEGKNYAALLAEIEENDYDLVVLGARGLGAVKPKHEEAEKGFDVHNTKHFLPSLGSVTERLIRRSKANLLIVKNDTPIEGKIVVAIDGSQESFSGVRCAVSLAKRTGSEIEAVASFDPHFHTVAFRELESVLSKEAKQIFRFQEQEKLHNEIIDKGIAQIYQDHLETAFRVAADDDFEIKITLLEGRPFQSILAYCEKEKPTLLIVGRLGVHADEGLDIGATAENLARFAPCHVLLVADKFDPTTGEEILEAITEGVPWTKEALERLDHIPPFARSFARKAIDDYAREHSIPEITPEIMTDVREKIGM